MAFCFLFHDTPRLGDKWQTKIDIDVISHTRPVLIRERDRFTREYSSSYAERELMMAICHGLQEFAFTYFPVLKERVHKELEVLGRHAMGDLFPAYGARQGDGPSIKEYEALERRHLKEVLDTPEIVERFVKGPLLYWSELDPVERIQEIYGLRGARLGEMLPYSKRAPELLAEAFREKLVKNKPPREPWYDDKGELDVRYVPEITEWEIYELHEEIFDELIQGLVKQMEEQPVFLDRLLMRWVVPILERRFEELDGEIDAFLAEPQMKISRQELFRRLKADEKWLELAKELGNPVPEEGEVKGSE